MESKKFKPCPFCGSEPRYLPLKPGFYVERVICDQCAFWTTPETWENRVNEDSVMLDWFEKNEECVVKLGTYWYYRIAYGKPLKKTFLGLRDAINKVISEQSKK